MGHALSEWIYIGGVKAFADGSLGSNSALFYEVRPSIQISHINFLLVNIIILKSIYYCPYSVSCFSLDMGGRALTRRTYL